MPEILSEIEFEGVLVKPAAGSYYCPFRCGTPGYPAPHWKTEKGFRKHMETCRQKPSAVSRRKLREESAREKFYTLRKRALAALPYHTGDTIHYLEKTKDEAGVRYTAKTTVIESIDAVFRHTAPKDLKGMLERHIVFNNFIKISDLCKSGEEAEIKAGQLNANGGQPYTITVNNSLF